MMNLQHLENLGLTSSQHSALISFPEHLHTTRAPCTLQLDGEGGYSRSQKLFWHVHEAQCYHAKAWGLGWNKRGGDEGGMQS